MILSVTFPILCIKELKVFPDYLVNFIQEKRYNWELDFIYILNNGFQKLSEKIYLLEFSQDYRVNDLFNILVDIFVIDFSQCGISPVVLYLFLEKAFCFLKVFLHYSENEKP